MALIELKFYSEVLQRQSEIYVDDPAKRETSNRPGKSVYGANTSSQRHRE